LILPKLIGKVFLHTTYLSPFESIMDKIQKFLSKLTSKEQASLAKLLERIIDGKVSELHIKKLKGHSDIYRVRTGDIRIIFRNRNNDILVLEVSRRNDNTYRKY